MQILRPTDFTGSRAWDGLPIATLTGSTTVRLHWTDQPYHWHVNDGHEVFVVLDGVVDMHTRSDGPEPVERVHRLQVGDIFYAEPGDAHVAHPQGVARILVVEREGSE